MGRWLWLLWRNDATPVHSRMDNSSNPIATAATPSPINSLHGGATNALLCWLPPTHIGVRHNREAPMEQRQGGGGQSCCEGTEAG